MNSEENKDINLGETSEVELNETLRSFESGSNETSLIEEEPAASEQVEETFEQKIAALKEMVTPRFHELLHSFERRRSNKMGVKISVDFPLKRVANFIILKQIRITFVNTRGEFSPYTLYVQYLLTTCNHTFSSDIVTRTIWSKEGKFITDNDTRISPEIRKIADSLSETFGFYSKRVTDIMFPF